MFECGVNIIILDSRRVLARCGVYAKVSTTSTSSSTVTTQEHLIDTIAGRLGLSATYAKDNGFVKRCDVCTAVWFSAHKNSTWPDTNNGTNAIRHMTDRSQLNIYGETLKANSYSMVQEATDVSTVLLIPIANTVAYGSTTGNVIVMAVLEGMWYHGFDKVLESAFTEKFKQHTLGTGVVTQTAADTLNIGDLSFVYGPSVTLPVPTTEHSTNKKQGERC